MKTTGRKAELVKKLISICDWAREGWPCGHIDIHILKKYYFEIFSVTDFLVLDSSHVRLYQKHSKVTATSKQPYEYLLVAWIC